MNAADFAAWVAAMAAERRWSKRRCALALGCGKAQIRIWAATGAPLYIGLACAALADELPPWLAMTRVRGLGLALRRYGLRR